MTETDSASATSSSLLVRIESSWDTDDGHGRRIEVTVEERRHPSEDPVDDTVYFASGDVPKLKVFLGELLDRKASSLPGRELRECGRCERVVRTASRELDFVCPECA